MTAYLYRLHVVHPLRPYGAFRPTVCVMAQPVSQFSCHCSLLGRCLQERIDGADCWRVDKAPGGISSFPMYTVEFEGTGPQAFHPVHYMFNHPKVLNPTHYWCASCGFSVRACVGITYPTLGYRRVAVGTSAGSSH